MGISNEGGTATRRSRLAGQPVVIEARGIDKTFRIPENRVDSLKERVLRPFSQGEFRDLEALRDVSFEVRRGEFFGIAGRNGSGKSTLLKILASIYAADAGTVRVVGNVAPFIELGVGFNSDLTARENVVINGVMMGLHKREAERRLGEVLEFAELEEFADLKLKNYSSGMLVRLAFSVMLQSDAETLLIDEVLAVGDAAFQDKCISAFYEMREAGRTIVLVTHSMEYIERFCDRALLLSGGRIVYLGDPEEVGRRYMTLNFMQRPSAGEAELPEEAGAPADLRLLDAWLEVDDKRTENVEHGAEVTFHALFEGVAEVDNPSFGFMVVNAEGADVFGFDSDLTMEEEHGTSIRPAERVEAVTSFANLLASGRHTVKCWVHRGASQLEQVLHVPQAVDFTVFGVEPVPGLVALADKVEVARVGASREPAAADRERP